MRQLDLSSGPRLTELWNEFFPARFRLSRDTVERSLLSCDRIVNAGSFMTDQGFVVLKRSGTPDWFSGQDPLRGHVSALVFIDEQSGAELLAAALSTARAEGMTSIVFGMDPDHLWPGCPVEVPILNHVLTAAGFEPFGEWFDLERDLSDFHFESRCQSNLDACHASVSPCRSQDLVPLHDFLLKTFPGRWRHDTMRKAVEDEEHEDIQLLWLDGQVEGFALTQHDGCRRPIGGAVWRADLGLDWGALGPIGVSESIRGRGLGDALLGCSLKSLHEKGAKRTIIDWTILEKFYGRFGFDVSRRYQGLRLSF